MPRKSPASQSTPASQAVAAASPGTATGNARPFPRTIRPIGTYSLQDLIGVAGHVVVLDTVRGYLLEVNLTNDDAIVLNPHQIDLLRDATSIACWESDLWFTRDDSVYVCRGAIQVNSTPSANESGFAQGVQGEIVLNSLKPERFVTLNYLADGVAVWDTTVYVTCQKAGAILVFAADTGEIITKHPAPGIGVENLTVRGEELWVCDTLEQTVYCLDRATGEVQFSILTPFEGPTGLAFLPPVEGEDPILYVSYAGEEAYVRDDPNADPPHQLAWRDRTFLHPLFFAHYPAEHYTLSNGYLIEMAYVEELSSLESISLRDVEWRIALPSETPRQKVRWVQPVGMPFTEELQEGQRVAVFRFDSLHPDEGRLFGWRAQLEVYGIKYNLTPPDVEGHPPLPPELQVRYLIDDDDLAMGSSIVQDAARVAIGRETNTLRQMISIRNYVYDRLSYALTVRIEPPDVVLRRGTGSCGEYVGVLLALARLNGIACRTVGRYKCPNHPEIRGVPLQPDFNHVWLEFLIPGIGWLPMESNPDDIQERGPYPTRFFMGLAWYHTELGRGITFEVVKTEGVPLADTDLDISIGDLALNHIQFTILDELMPPQPGN